MNSVYALSLSKDFSIIEPTVQASSLIQRFCFTPYFPWSIEETLGKIREKKAKEN